MRGETSLSDSLNRVLGRFLDAARLIEPHRLAALISAGASELGADASRVWLADHQQRNLVHLTSSEQSKPLSIEGTAAGRAFITSEVLEVGDDTDSLRVWFPLLDGVDRIGVLEVEIGSLTPERREAFRHFVSVATAEILTRGQYTDLFTEVRRQRAMSLAAEMQWQALPPISFSTHAVSVAGMVEPAYDVGGDLFDYAHTEDELRFAIFDAVGHDLSSSVISSLALGTYRHSRRSGKDLRGAADAIDHTIRGQLGRSLFATGQLAALNTSSGVLRWINAGHPLPLLIRQRSVVGPLACRPRVPFGFGHLESEPAAEIAETQLEPGDGVLLYSDGVIEARRTGNEDFGVERLEAFLGNAFAAGLPPAETLRRLSNAVLDFHSGILQDDATTLLVVWHPDD